MRLSSRFWLASSLAILTAIISLRVTPLFAQSDTPVSHTPATTGLQLAYSPGIGDILKMLDAKVDVDVIRAYIKNSPIPFSPSAAEIIALKNHGVPDELITAMIQRGAEVRTQLAQAAQMAASSPSPTATGPGYGTTAPYSYPDYSASYPSDYSYAGGYPYYPYYYPYYPYYYGYGYPYWWYSTYYPFGCFWPFYCGVHSHSHFAYFHDGHFHGTHPFPHNGFVNHAGVVNHSGAWASAHGFAHSPAMVGHVSMGHAPMAARGFAFAGGARMGGGFAGHAAMGHAGGFGGGGHGGGHR